MCTGVEFYRGELKENDTAFNLTVNGSSDTMANLMIILWLTGQLLV